MNTRFGVHHPSDYYWNPPTLIPFCEDLKRHGVSWYTLWANDLHQVEFAKALIDHDIEVIYRPGQNLIPCQFIGGIYEQYRHAGVRYCQFYNEPNLSGEWKDGVRMSPEKFAELWAPRCQALKSLGFIPVVPPLSPGGNIWHPDFFHRMMNWWKNQGLLPDLLRGCVLGIHNRPVTNPPDDQGVCSFDGGYKTHRQWMMDIMGFTLPMVAPEAGYEPQWVGYDWEKWKDWNLELIRRFRPGHPKYVGDDFLAHCFWIYHDTGSTWDHCGLVENWFYAQDHGGDRTTNLWRALEHEDWGQVPDPVGPVDPVDPVGPPPPPDPTDIEFVGLTDEMIERLSISEPEDPTKPYWKITRVEIQPQTDNMSAYAVFTDYKEYAEFWWGSGRFEDLGSADDLAPEGAKQWAASMPMFATWGGYGVKLGGNSEGVFGFGLYQKEGDTINPNKKGHHPVLVYFKQVQPGEPEPDPGPEPEPQPTEFTIFDACKRWGLELTDKRVTCARHAHLDRIQKRKPRQWNGIVVHHTASNYSGQTPESIAIYHTKAKDNGGRGFASIAYHFVVGFEGEPYFTAPVSWATDHCGGLEMETIGIAVMGDFTTKEPTEAQVETVRRLILALQDWLGRGKPRRCYVLPHCYVWPTKCPGALKKKLVWEGEWP